MNYIIELFIILIFIIIFIFKIKNFNNKNILLIKKNINIIDILNCINKNDWEYNRAKYNKIHENTKCITIIDNYKNIKVNKKKYFPVFEFLNKFKKDNKCDIYGVKIIFLGKNKFVKPHIDGIRNNIKYTKYYDDKDRYHLVLDGSYNLYCGDKVKKLKKGDLCWFNNKKIHYVKANSDRIALIFDVKH